LRSDGFQWIEAATAEDSVYAWMRRAPEPPVLVVVQFHTGERHATGCGLPAAGNWNEVLNTDAPLYGGSNQGNPGGVSGRGEAMHGQAQSAPVTLPPLSAVVIPGRREAPGEGERCDHDSDTS
jgi:1,4-alpha-glucan branching enzyme